jgi:geranylgeranyl reductase family protein
MMIQKIYDVAIVGAGPAGATCAWYLARRGVKALVLDKHVFPRDKICGDAICSVAQDHLERMGVLQKIVANDEGRAAAIGGMVSPAGIRYIDSSPEYLRSRPVMGIKRFFMDARIAAAAKEAGAKLVEDYNVADVEFDSTRKLWTILPLKGGSSYQTRALILADGALSRLARKLGHVSSPPEAVCSRTYIRAKSSDFDCDGLVFYPKDMLPGYCALFREARDELNFCVYILPGGRTELSDLRTLHDRLIKSDPHISKAIGRHAVMDEMKGAPLRIGGIKKSFGDHLIILGDAAGQIDPLTGEGIQYAMDAAEIAADVLVDAVASGDFSEQAMGAYHRRWYDGFGRDFVWSARLARFYRKCPVMIDASALTLQRLKGPFLAQWAEIVTGARPKTDFMKPKMLLPILRDLPAALMLKQPA